MIAAAGFVQSCFLCKAVLCALWCATSAAEQQRCELMNYTLRLQLRSACGDAEQLYGVSRAKWTRKKRVFHAFADAPSETAPRLRDVAAMSGVNFDALRNMDGFVEHLSQNHSEPADAILASHAPDAALRQTLAAVAVSPAPPMEEGSDSEAPDDAPVSGEETEVERLRRELEQ